MQPNSHAAATQQEAMARHERCTHGRRCVLQVGVSARAVGVSVMHMTSSWSRAWPSRCGSAHSPMPILRPSSHRRTDTSSTTALGCTSNSQDTLCTTAYGIPTDNMLQMPRRMQVSLPDACAAVLMRYTHGGTMERAGWLQFAYSHGMVASYPKKPAATTSTD